MADERRSVFLSPHYDDVALSCGGTVAASADEGDRPLIITVFGGPPRGPLNPFAEWMHERWGFSADETIAQRRREESRAASALGAESCWLDFPDAIYRDAFYTSDPELFGPIHLAERGLVREIADTLLAMLKRRGITTERFYVPLAVGDHVDHQHVLQLGRRLVALGYEVLGYEDFPYAGDPAGLALLQRQINAAGNGQSITRFLAPEQLERRISAISCYASQLPVIFRNQGDPAEATRRWAMERGHGRPAERFWRLRP